MKGLLITGATGFIGGHLAEAASKSGYQVWALVRPSSDVSLLRKSAIQLIYGDISDRESINLCLSQLKNKSTVIDFVVHCAGQTKAKNEEEFMQANCQGTANLVEALKNAYPNIQKIIFLSSLAASGPATLNQVISLDREAPVTDYGKSKLAAEQVVKNSGIPFLILRPTAVYGPGEKDIFTLFKIIKKGINPIIGSQPQQLTFIYIKDLVEIILRCLQSSNSSATYFVSDGQVYDKFQLAQYIEKSLHKKARRIVLPLGLVKSMAYLAQTFYAWQNKWSPLNLEKFKELKAQSWVCDVNPTFRALNYIPEYNLESGVYETTLWYLKEKWI